jgi:hypothetical protein
MKSRLHDYLLEKRICKLEKLIYNEEELNTNKSSKIHSDLFSDNIKEVKAAINEGQSVDELNEDGYTPLSKICASENPNIAIAKLLLDNGADASTYGSRVNTCLVDAIKVSANVDLIKLLVANSADIGVNKNRNYLVSLALDEGIHDIDILESLIPLSDKNMTGVMQSIIKWYIKNRASNNASTYGALLSYIFSSDIADQYFRRFSFGIYIIQELTYCKTMLLFNSLTDFGVWPFQVSHLDTDEYKVLFSSNEYKKILYNGLLKVLRSNNPILGRMDYFIDNIFVICKKLRQPIDTLLGYLTPEIMSKATVDQIENLLYKCIETKEDVSQFKLILDLSKNVLKSKGDEFTLLERIILITSKRASKEMTLQVIRLIRILHPDFDLELLKEDSFLKSIGAANSSIGSMLAVSHNKLLIDYFVDQGYGGDIRISVSQEEISDEAREALKNDKSITNSEEITKSNKIRRAAAFNNKHMLTDGISYITDDNHPNVTSLFNQFPELVNSEEFYKKAVELSKDSMNARQAVQYIDSHKPEKSDDEFSGYDM